MSCVPFVNTMIITFFSYKTWECPRPLLVQTFPSLFRYAVMPQCYDFVTSTWLFYNLSFQVIHSFLKYLLLLLSVLIISIVLRYLGFDHAATLFHIRDSPSDPVERSILLTNTFNFAVLIHDVLLPEDAKAMFKVSFHIGIKSSALSLYNALIALVLFNTNNFLLFFS